MNRKKLLVVIICSLLIGGGSTYFTMNYFGKQVNPVKITDRDQVREIDFESEKLDKVDQTYELILTEFVEQVSEEQLVEGAVQGMLASLDDPYSVYMDKETTKQFNESLDSSFEGIGAEVSLVGSKIVIISPFKDSPAEKAGLKPNDEIISIDGESIAGLDLYEATVKLRGEKGTSVQIEIVRSGQSQPLIVDVVRDEIPLETIHSKVFEEGGKKLGYIEITSFSEETGADFKKALTKLERQNISGLAIDLRGNPGGLLSTVQEISKEIITDKKPYVQTESREGEKTRFFTRLKKQKPYPIVSLINQGSASASEILAAALKEGEGYQLVGEQTFGKGTVQHPIDMTDGSSIKLTSLKWLTSDGNWIHKEGIAPSLEVSQPKLYSLSPLQIENSLSLDETSEEVKHVQHLLQSFGYEPGREDGYFSKQTEVAVRAFQQTHDLAVTGTVDEETANKISEVLIKETTDDKNDLQLQAALKLLLRD